MGRKPHRSDDRADVPDELLDRCRAGDESAWDELWGLLRRPLEALAGRMISTRAISGRLRPEEEAPDFLDHLCLLTLQGKGLHKYQRREEPFMAWLLKCAGNHFKDRSAWVGRGGVSSSEEAEEAPAPPASTEAESLRERGHGCLAGLSGMSVEQRVLFKLVYVLHAARKRAQEGEVVELCRLDADEAAWLASRPGFPGADVHPQDSASLMSVLQGCKNISVVAGWLGKKPGTVYVTFHRVRKQLGLR
jgi:DNA-directed RNA polymerase specialized sigma24 family protein